MFTLIVLAICVPLVAGIGYLVLRNRHPEFLADVRGIALQTVIIIVVLLAIAGAVAGVLITRGDEAVTELEAASISTDYTGIRNQATCQSLNGTWKVVAASGAGPQRRSVNSCQAPGSLIRAANSQAACWRLNGRWVGSPRACQT